MKKRYTILLCLFFFAQLSKAQKQPLTYYLPDVNYNDDIPTPEAYLGYQIGEWHISHDQQVSYLRELARLSPRMTIETYARSYENRPLVLVTATSEKNHKNIDKIKEQRQAICDASKSVNLDDAPVVIYQGYTIHGNEASGANAAVLIAYYLAAAPDSEVKKLLDNAVVLIDPCFNPDGMNRFANWVNVHKSKNLVTDPQDREYEEVWPRGRTNHYWFDLNRDWLLVQHPESQGRIRNFHIWKPNILTDHHEMGTNSTYFFQPGVPSRTNPLTPKMNQELTGKIADYHAKNLDKIGSLYYTRESFDDFYYGKGSTYPDANGCVGILFEQASSRGHIQESVNGILTFPFTIRNQVQTSLSTQQAGLELRKELLEFQKDFFKTAASDASKDGTKGYVFGEAADESRLHHFLDLLLQHKIEVYAMDKDSDVDGTKFKKGSSYVVPLDQPQYRLAKAMFETSTTFTDSLFYDVSSWTLPYSFNIPYAKMTSLSGLSKNNKLSTLPKRSNQIIGDKTNYAYLFEWDDYDAPKVLYHLQKNGLIAKVAQRPFQSATSEGAMRFDYGTIMLSVQIQDKDEDEIYKIVQDAIANTSVKVYAVKTGMTPDGIDLGSPNMTSLKKPSVLLVVGNGVNSYDAGEVWHLLDQRYDMPLSKAEVDEIGSMDLNRYTTIVMVDGSYHSLNASNIKTWTNEGGTLITFKRAATWAAKHGMSGVKARRSGNTTDTKVRRPYDRAGDDRGSRYIGGAIFETELDLTHPIAYGYNDKRLPVFRRGTLFFEVPRNPYSSPLLYTSDPLLSGYISANNEELIKGSASIVVSGVARGRNISFADNTNFRAFWLGTNKLFANAIFFGSAIGGSTVESPTNTTPKEEEMGHGHQH